MVSSGPEQPGDEGRAWCWPRRRRGRRRCRRSRRPSAAAMAWPLPPAPPGPAHHAAPRRRGPGSAVSSGEPSSSTMTSSTSPLPAVGGQEGLDHRPHHRAHGRALVAGRDAHRDRPARSGPWPRGPGRSGSPRGGRSAPRPRFKQPGCVEAAAPGGLPWSASSRATEGRAR